MGEASLPLPDHISERVPHRALSVLSDTRLARLAAEGSRGAFAAIYERHQQALYRYCRSILGNPDEAKDALQNTMVSALRALPGEKRTIALRPWLFRVAHNEAISILRRRSPEAPIEQAEDAAAIVSDATVRERLRTLFEDLQELPERQRGALVMRELNGLSYADIAAALHASEAAAKQIVYEARTALHELEEGREMECEAARRSISARDGRVMRGRKLRAHLRSCDDCRSFRDAISGRRTDLKALAPPLPAPAAAALLSGMLNGGGGGAGGGGIGAVVGGAAAESIGGSAAIKAGVLAVAAGLGVAGTGLIVGSHDPSTPAAVENHGAAGANGVVVERMSAHDSVKGDGSQLRGGAQSLGHPSGAGPAGAHPGSGSPAGTVGASGGGGSHPADAPGGDAPAPPADDPGGGGGSAPSGGGGSTPEGGGGGAPAPSTSPPSGGGSSGGGPIGTPPGHGGTPPGQGGTPPGLATQPPGLGGTPPGQGGTPPGQDK